MEMNHSNEFVGFVNHGHRDDPVLLHSVDNGTSELVIVREPWSLSHDGSHRNRHHVVFTLHQSREVTGSDDASHCSIFVFHYSYTSSLGELNDGLAHRCVRRQDGKEIARYHHVFHLSQKAPAERAAGMQPRKVSNLKSLLFKKRNRKRIADGQRHGRARSWS